VEARKQKSESEKPEAKNRKQKYGGRRIQRIKGRRKAGYLRENRKQGI
jgi:hypothetical protein